MRYEQFVIMCRPPMQCSECTRNLVVKPGWDKLPMIPRNREFIPSATVKNKKDTLPMNNAFGGLFIVQVE